MKVGINSQLYLVGKFRWVCGGSKDSIGAVWACWARGDEYSTNAEISWSLRESTLPGEGGDSGEFTSGVLKL